MRRRKKGAIKERPQSNRKWGGSLPEKRKCLQLDTAEYSVSGLRCRLSEREVLVGGNHLCEGVILQGGGRGVCGAPDANRLRTLQG